jgi:hypothetical protein
VHTFTKALDLTIPSGAGTIVPATFENGAWRTITPVPGGTSLPTGWTDGFYASGSDIHILAKHLSTFSLLEDAQAPSKPGGFAGVKQNGRLVLKWKAATDNSGAVDSYLVYGNGLLIKTVGGSARSADVEAFKTSDSRSFQVAARDAAGNVGAKSRALVILPALKKLTLSRAQARLTARGLRSGALRFVYSTTIAAGRIVSAPTGVVVKGSAVALNVSKGPLGSTYTPPPSTTSGGDVSGYGGYGTGSTTGSGFAGTTSGGTTTGGSTPTSSTTGGPAGGSLTPASATGGSKTVGGVEPESFTPGDDNASGLRRLLGFMLLGGAFLAAGAFALRARRPRVPRGDVTAGVEPLLFWDQRLLHAVTASVRRVTGRF